MDLVPVAKFKIDLLINFKMITGIQDIDNIIYDYKKYLNIIVMFQNIIKNLDILLIELNQVKLNGYLLIYYMELPCEVIEEDLKLLIKKNILLDILNYKLKIFI